MGRGQRHSSLVGTERETSLWTRRWLKAVAVIGALSALLWGCSALIGLQDPPAQTDASTGGGDDGSMPNNDSTTSSGDDGGDGGVNPTGRNNGMTCVLDSDCRSTHCTDGVCCDGLCNGTCESCALVNARGICTPIPSGTDPDKECVAVSLDSGLFDAAAPSPSPDGSSEGGPSSGASDAASADASASVNCPDGGCVTDDTKCSGSCNGQRACMYPGPTKSCGTAFCNTSTEQGSFVCDGQGQCQLNLQACTQYTCSGTGCGTSCTGPADCVDTHYCNGALNQCRPKLAQGVQCSVGNQCQSGFCTAGAPGTPGGTVCCESECTVPGGVCNASGTEGLCKCSLNCGDGGSCKLFYADMDHDGFGDKYGSTTANPQTAKVGCSNQPPPIQFVDNNTDCDDTDPNVNPNQTMFFATKSNGGTWDYNCDGTIEKQTPNFPGTCEFCETSDAGVCSAGSTTCPAASVASAFTCGPRPICSFRPPFPPHCIFVGCYTSAITGYAYQPARPTPDPNPAFDCGLVKTATTCGSCAAAGQGPANTFSSVQQKCQ